MENLKTEINVGTWLSVIAEIARSRNSEPVRDVDRFTFRLACAEGAVAQDLKEARDARRSLLKLAAEAMRMAEECFPGDGLFDEPKGRVA